MSAMQCDGRASALPWLGLGLAVSFALGGAASGAAAQQMRYAFGHSDTYSQFGPIKKFADALTGAGAPMTVVPRSLLSLAETANGVRDGLADAGFVLLPYNPAEFSETILPANLSMLATTGDTAEVPAAALNGATMEYILLNCPDCVTQMAGQNQVYLSGGASPVYILACNKRVSTIEELKGKRIRTGAGNFTRWAEFVGASPVALPGNEIYDALGHGVVDCAAISMEAVYGARYIEVTKSVTTGVPGGIFSGIGMANFNIESWNRLTVEQRGVALKASAALAAESVMAFHADDLKGYEEARKMNIEIIEAPEDLLALNAKFVEADMAVIEKEMTEQYGIRDAGQKIARFRSLLEKWNGLAAGVGTDTAKLEQLYWDEIFAKVDPATYGVQ